MGGDSLSVRSVSSERNPPVSCGELDRLGPLKQNDRTCYQNKTSNVRLRGPTGGEGAAGKGRRGELQLEREANGRRRLEPATLEPKPEVLGRSRSPGVYPPKGAGPWELVGRRSTNPRAVE